MCDDHEPEAQAGAGAERSQLPFDFDAAMEVAGRFAEAAGDALEYGELLRQTWLAEVAVLAASITDPPELRNALRAYLASEQYALGESSRGLHALTPHLWVRALLEAVPPNWVRAVVNPGQPTSLEEAEIACILSPNPAAMHFWQRYGTTKYAAPAFRRELRRIELGYQNQRRANPPERVTDLVAGSLGPERIFYCRDCGHECDRSPIKYRGGKQVTFLCHPCWVLDAYGELDGEGRS